MNDLAEIEVDKQAFSYLNLQGRDQWLTFAPVFGSLTVVGTPNYSGRYRFVGRQCQFQVRFSAGTSIASVAGTDYLTLPFTAAGLSGIAVMSDDTTNILVGGCHIDVSTSRCYLPTRTASSDVFNICGSFEV